MVKEFEEQEIPQVSIVLDCDASQVGDDKFDGNFETIVKLAASMTDYLGGLYCKMAFVCGPRPGAATPSVELGLAFALRREIDELLTDIQPSAIGVNELLDASLELHPPGSILYVLSMSAPDGLDSRLDRLSEDDVDVRWILAPRALFPAGGAEPDPSALRLPESLSHQPLICGSKTRLSSLVEYG
jgi:hypothetical protein